MFSDNFRACRPAEYQMATYLRKKATGFIQGNAQQPFVPYASSKEPHPVFTGRSTGYAPVELAEDCVPAGGVGISLSSAAARSPSIETAGRYLSAQRRSKPRE